MDQFNIGLPSVLNTYGFETKLMTPNFEAIKEFLNVRFNMRVDNYNENNPFKDSNKTSILTINIKLLWLLKHSDKFVDFFGRLHINRNIAIKGTDHGRD